VNLLSIANEFGVMDKHKQYSEIIRNLKNLLSAEEELIAMMATISCELKYSFEAFSWVGFYRVVKPGLLKVGPYQGSHGCIDISFERGVCGKCASERKTQIVQDVEKIPYHIACSSETKSEIVVPVFDSEKTLIGVLDIDSIFNECFDEVDQLYLEKICSMFKNCIKRT
jgi:GAF domain-containing protein